MNAAILELQKRLSTNANLNLWRPENRLSKLVVPSFIHPWLSDSGSLSKALQEMANGSFEVSVISQVIATPFCHEQIKLNRAQSLVAVIRQVTLSIFGEPVVYARSVIPLALMTQGRSGLANLGSAPLGHLLFKDGKIRASKREIACTVLGKETIYARRTPYDYLNGRILVSEYFLPSLRKYLIKNV